MVTDYSSLGFEMAYLERPVVYFQFDQDTFFNGAHAYRQGTWRYERDGFGPVTLDADNGGGRDRGDHRARTVGTEPVYAERMLTTFPSGTGSARSAPTRRSVTSTRPMTDAELYRRLEPAELLEGVPVELPTR